MPNGIGSLYGGCLVYGTPYQGRQAVPSADSVDQHARGMEQVAWRLYTS